MGWERLRVWGTIALLWASAVLPNLGLRSFIWEEGSNAELARDMLERGDLLRPLLHGVVWVEKPSLLPWLIAAVGKLGGGVGEWTARLPSMLCVLLTALMVQALTRRHASLRASVFAAFAFMLCPLVLQKLTIAEPDTVITALSFAAFVLWWNGAEHGAPSLTRWIGCGALLAVLAMAKGPQPVGFFALGVGLHIVIARRWRELPGLVVCLLCPLIATLVWAAAVYRPDGNTATTWLQYLRLAKQPKSPTLLQYLAGNGRTIFQLAIELLPALMLAPFAPGPWRRPRPVDAPAVVTPLVCYATACTAILLVWPLALSRYAMPIAPAVAVLGGLAWDRLAATKHVWLRNLATGVVTALGIYQMVLTIAIVPIFADRFGSARIDGGKIAEAVRTQAVPVYCEEPANNDQFFYAHVPMTCYKWDQYLAIPAPAWLLASSEDLDELAKARPELEIRRVLTTKAGGPVVTALILPRAKTGP
jgi:4-amino-4-deoxy-L-arabinose transferase-like glycosyltransferase